MKRRSFIKMLAAGTAILGVFGGIQLAQRREDLMEAIIRRKLSYLKIESEGLNQYIQDFLQTRDKVWNKSWSKLQAYDFYGKFHAIIPVSEESNFHFNYTDYTEDLVRNYLLSTDFFISGMDESKELEYLGFFNPHKYPCRNPLVS